MQIKIEIFLRYNIFENFCPTGQVLLFGLIQIVNTKIKADFHHQPPSS